MCALVLIKLLCKADALQLDAFSPVGLHLSVGLSFRLYQVIHLSQVRHCMFAPTALDSVGDFLSCIAVDKLVLTFLSDECNLHCFLVIVIFPAKIQYFSFKCKFFAMIL